MKILITGAAGFIGSHTCERFCSSGHEVIGLDNFDPFYPEHFKWQNLDALKPYPNFQFFKGDIRDIQLLDQLFGDHRIDAVVHLAAKAGVRPSIEHIGDYYEVNVTGTLRILEAMKRRGVRRMVFASSSSVYGNNRKLPFAETDAVDFPISPYASTKKSGELLCHVYTHLHQFDISCLRFFTVYGPRQRPDLAIHKFTRFLDTGQKIPFYGDGSTGRDYTFIEDIVSGIQKAFEHLGGYHIYNLGESQVITLNRLITTLSEAMGKEPLLERLPMQPGDVDMTYADISLAKTAIGYSPVTEFSKGIQDFVSWYQSHKSGLYP